MNQAERIDLSIVESYFGSMFERGEPKYDQKDLEIIRNNYKCGLELVEKLTEETGRLLNRDSFEPYYLQNSVKPTIERIKKIVDLLRRCKSEILMDKQGR